VPSTPKSGSMTRSKFKSKSRWVEPSESAPGGRYRNSAETCLRPNLDLDLDLDLDVDLDVDLDYRAQRELSPA